MTLDERDPIVMADTGPLIRLAAAGLLDGLRATNRRVVIVDRVEAEATQDRSKPFANEIADMDRAQCGCHRAAAHRCRRGHREA